LVNSGLKRGLGTIMSMIAYFKEGSHAGIESDPLLHPWVACANNVTGDKDAEYWWYRVAMCANPGQTVESCIDSVKMPADLVEPIRECTNDPSKSSKLVNDMHLYGNGFQRFRWPLIDGKACLPQPDTHGDDITPLIQVGYRPNPRASQAFRGGGSVIKRPSSSRLASRESCGQEIVRNDAPRLCANWQGTLGSRQCHQRAMQSSSMLSSLDIHPLPLSPLMTSLRMRCT